MTPLQIRWYWREWAAVRRAQPDADRHALHIAALGVDKSSKRFTNRDLDKVIAEFRAISQPNNINAQVRQLSQSATRALHTIRSFPELYVIRVARDKFGTTDIAHLTDPQLLTLAMTLNNRDIEQPVPSAVEPSSVLSELVDCPF
jgi:hypothetical protein